MTSIYALEYIDNEISSVEWDGLHEMADGHESAIVFITNNKGPSFKNLIVL